MSMNERLGGGVLAQAARNSKLLDDKCLREALSIPGVSASQMDKPLARLFENRCGF